MMIRHLLTLVATLLLVGGPAGAAAQNIVPQSETMKKGTEYLPY